MGQSCDEMGYVTTLKLRLVRGVFNAAYQLFFHLCRQNPRQISMITMRNDKLADNLLAVYQQFLTYQKEDGTTIKTLCFHYDHSLWGKVKLMIKSFKALHLIATSRVTVLDDYLMPLSAISKHEENRVVQLWHAIGTLKKFGQSLPQNQHTKQILPPHINYDAVFINAKQDAFAYQDAFVVTPKQIIASGMPMMDEIATSKIVPAKPQTLLYSPTYRSGGADITLTYIKDFIDATQKLAGNWQIYISLHPYLQVPSAWDIPKNVHLFQDPGYVKELMKTVSVFVTDYSSLSLTYSYYERPILLYVPDLKKYLAKTGFYVDYLSYLNAPYFKTSHAVIDFINHQLATLDCQYVAALKHKNFPHQDGKNAVRVYHYIKQHYLLED